MFLRLLISTKFLLNIKLLICLFLLVTWMRVSTRESHRHIHKYPRHRIPFVLCLDLRGEVVLSCTIQIILCVTNISLIFITYNKNGFRPTEYGQWHNHHHHGYTTSTNETIIIFGCNHHMLYYNTLPICVLSF